MAHRAFIGIGSNLGDRLANYLEALERLRTLRDSRIVRQSSIYETEPIGGVAGAFLNGAVEMETELGPDSLMNQLLAIERNMGRKRLRRPKLKTQYQPRIMDLDLLFFNKEIINTPKLTVPHPRLHERRFVLIPLSELAPALIHPQLNATISELLAGLKVPQRVALMRADLLKPAPPRREVASR